MAAGWTIPSAAPQPSDWSYALPITIEKSPLLLQNYLSGFGIIIGCIIF
jgi:hypothetical protein